MWRASLSLGGSGRVFGFDVLLLDERMCAMAVPGREVLLLFRQNGSVGAQQNPFRRHSCA